MNAKLKCHKCDACAVVVVKQEALEKKTGAPLVGAAGVVPVELISLIVSVVSAVLAWLQFKQGKQKAEGESGLVAVCKSCGFWEKL